MAIKNFPPVRRTIAQTTQYEMFGKIKGNRAVDAKRVSKIKKSILENGYICNPIIVNEKMEIIDGQGRFHVLKELGMPVDYIIVPGTGVNECTAMNVAATNWTMLDYITSYAETGNENYIRLKSLIEQYNGVVPYSTVAGIAMGLTDARNQRVNKEVIGGTFTCSDNEVIYARKRLDWLASFKPIYKKCASKVTLVSCLLALYDMENLDRERLLNRLLESKTVTGYANKEECFDVLTEVYNYRLRPESRLDFKHWYKFSV